MKSLLDILVGVKVLKQKGKTIHSINSICFDSGSIQKGDIFVAIKGTKTDGHKYIREAIEKGANSVMCEKMPEERTDAVLYLQVENSAKALATISANYFDNPSRKLKLIGITGTNGKTTAATLLYRLFRKAGYATGLISTIENYINDKVLSTTHTTPDVITLNRLFYLMVEEGCEYCFMEVSSHAVLQHRITGLSFIGGVFTNITHEHLDYHKTFKNYLLAKKQFFDDLPKEAFALVNTDDKNSKVMVQNCRASHNTYGIKTMADFKGKIIEIHFDGTLLEIEDTEMWTPLVGEFNAYNVLVVYAVSVLLGVEKQDVLTIISGLHEVDGRFECFHSTKGITAIVDYAHTPDALENILHTIQKIRKGNEQLITVVGAGGDRDKSKRPLMAKVSAEQSDKVILTSDNPRSENPDEIIKDMMEGIDSENSKKVLIIVDRKQAIKTACLMAKNGDLILVAGKGHETYQEINGIRSYFDDREIIKEQFSIMGIMDKTLKN